jgi:hypothetical protein
MIDPDILKTATFLMVNDEPSATVFFKQLFTEKGPGTASYAITTKHSIPTNPNSVVAIRFNLRIGGTEDQYFTPADWITSLTSDVAVLPLEIPLDNYDIRFVPNTASTKNHLVIYIQRHPLSKPGPEGEREIELKVPSWEYGTGDEVFTVGLFQGHTGQKLAQPVARFGHIALKPAEGEKILAEIHSELTPIDAFFVEMGTWKGQSGSPVFLHAAPTMEEKLSGMLSDFPQFSPQPKDYLIGMIQGFYPGIEKVKIDGKDAELSSLQMGIGIIIPTPSIIEVLLYEPLKEQRERLRKESARARDERKP